MNSKVSGSRAMDWKQELFLPLCVISVYNNPVSRPRKDDPLQVLNLRLPKGTIDIVKRRAEMLGIAPGVYLRQILEDWQKRGCPPVSLADEAIRQLQDRTKEEEHGFAVSSLKLESPKKKPAPPAPKRVEPGSPYYWDPDAQGEPQQSRQTGGGAA